VGRIQQARYDHLLRRTGAQVGPDSKVGNALEDLFPTLEVENCPIELLRAVGWRMGMGLVDVTAAVGTVNVHDLFNPEGSRHLVVLTRVIITVQGSTGTINWGLSNTQLSGVINTSVERDTRLSTTAETVAQISRQDNGGTPINGGIFALLNTQFNLEDQNGIAVLAPGSGFRVAVPATGKRMLTSWFWRERVAEPEELNF